MERFASAMRLRANLASRSVPGGPLLTFALADAHWAGMYADQLDVWAHFVGRDRLLVMTYEWAVKEPEAACDRVWSALDPEPAALHTGRTRIRNSTAGDEWDWSEGMRTAVTQLGAPQVDRLAND